MHIVTTPADVEADIDSRAPNRFLHTQPDAVHRMEAREDAAQRQTAGLKVHRIPKGCDQQGRHPEAGHAATEVGADDPVKRAEQARRFDAVSGDLWLGVIGCIAFWALLAALAIHFKG